MTILTLQSFNTFKPINILYWFLIVLLSSFHTGFLIHHFWDIPMARCSLSNVLFVANWQWLLCILADFWQGYFLTFVTLLFDSCFPCNAKSLYYFFFCNKVLPHCIHIVPGPCLTAFFFSWWEKKFAVLAPLIGIHSLIMPSPSYYESVSKENYIEKCQLYQHKKFQHWII